MSEAPQQYFYVSEQNEDRVVALIKRFIQRRRGKSLQNFLKQIHPTVLAHLWDLFDEGEQDIIISLLDPELSADFLSELDSKERGEILKSKDTNWIVDRLEELEADDVVDILKGLSQWEARLILRRFDSDYSDKIRELIQYPEETAGALMTSEFFAVRETAKVESIIRQFRKVVQRDDSLEDVHFIYVTDKSSRLMGYIPLRKLITEKPGAKAKEIMNPPPVTALPDLDQEEVAKLFRDYDLISLPIVNDDGILLGRITIDDALDVAEEEATEDVFRMVGLAKEERVSNSIATSLKNRLPWMFINLATTSASAAMVSMFTTIVQKYIVLAVFMPMIAALGGATGNQMVAMIVRGLAVGDLHWRHVRWILFREVSAVALGAVVIGSIAGTAAWYLQQQPELGYVVAVALLLNMVIATLIGAGIPLALKVFGLDPALGSSILVAAVTDIMGFFIFLGLATKILG